jgi:hypothetical protein
MADRDRDRTRLVTAALPADCWSLRSAFGLRTDREW